MSINDVLYQIRKNGAEPFRLAYVRSTGKGIGSVGSGDFLFADYIDTNADIIKLLSCDTGMTKTLKVSHILSYNKKPITR